MTHEESEDMSFWVSKLEVLVKGFVSKRDLEKSMNSLKGDLEKIKEGTMKTLQEMMEKKMEKLEESMEIIVNLIQHPKENLPNDDKVVQGTHDERNSSHFEKPSFSKSTPRGFDSNTGSNQ